VAWRRQELISGAFSRDFKQDKVVAIGLVYFRIPDVPWFILAQPRNTQNTPKSWRHFSWASCYHFLGVRSARYRADFSA
jgi:hypothetical protein